MIVSGLLLVATIVALSLYGGWIGLGVAAVVAVLVFAWGRSRDKPPPRPGGAQHEEGSPAALCS